MLEWFSGVCLSILGSHQVKIVLLGPQCDPRALLGLSRIHEGRCDRRDGCRAQGPWLVQVIDHSIMSLPAFSSTVPCPERRSFPCLNKEAFGSLQDWSLS